MRDILVTAIVFGFLPRALVDPFVGIALWTWVSVMNPHRMTWGFAFNFPFAYVIAVTTLIGVVVGARKVKFPWTPVTATMILFFIWLSVTYLTAIHFDESTDMWMRITKIQTNVRIWRSERTTASATNVMKSVLVMRIHISVLSSKWMAVRYVTDSQMKNTIMVRVTGVHGNFTFLTPTTTPMRVVTAIT